MNIKMQGATPVCCLSRSVTFQASHMLPMTPPDHKCQRMHGHSYEVRVTLKGPLREDGFVVDNSEIDRLLRKVYETFDHTCLNDAEGQLGSNPTAEWICVWVWQLFNLTDLRHLLHEVQVNEGPNSVFSFKGSYQRNG